MSTNDVPGVNPANRDELAMGAWAEHPDGSLIVVESTEDDRVIFSVFDVATKPVTEYRDAMPIGAFKRRFSWNGQKDTDRWTWHDKTPFPWDRVIRQGAAAGPRYASADDVETAAQRVRRSRSMKGKPVDEREIEARIERLRGAARDIARQIQEVIEELPP